MRTFTTIAIIAFVTLAAASSMGCSQDDDGNCGQVSGCGGDDDPMGGPDAGGGESCSTDDGDACEAPMAIHADPRGTCGDPDYPVLCPDNDGYCWPAGTDCGQPMFGCGAEAGRCESSDQAANCCGGTAYLCPADAPYYCTQDGTCRATSGECASTCQYYGADC